MKLGTQYRFAILFLITFGLLIQVNAYLGTPRPWVTDEFSYLLAADTFLDGRLTNPQHALPQFFENGHILVTPTYTSKFPPGQPLLLALGKLIFHQYFYGVLLALAAFATSAYWLLRMLIHDKLALIGSLLITFTFTIDSDWGRSYLPGALPATAACLALGSYILSFRKKSLSKPYHFAAGLLILSLTRPYEGGIFIAALAMFFVYDLIKKNISLKYWRSFAAITGSGLLLALALNAVYNRAVTGYYLLLPNYLHIQQYMYTPYFWFLKLRIPALVPSTDIVHQLYLTWEKQTYDYIWSLNAPAKCMYFCYRLISQSKVVVFAILAALFKPAIANLDGSVRRLQYLFAITIVTSSLITWLYNYYLFTSIVTGTLLSLCVFAETLSDRHHMTVTEKFFKLLYQVLCVALTVYILFIACQHAYQRSGENYPAEFTKNFSRENVTAQIGSKPGMNLVFVHYGDHHQSENEDKVYRKTNLYQLVLGYVYNGPDIDKQNTVFAYDLGHTENKKLIDYYRALGQSRRIWLLNLDGIRMNGENLQYGTPRLNLYR